MMYEYQWLAGKKNKRLRLEKLLNEVSEKLSEEDKKKNGEGKQDFSNE